MWFYLSWWQGETASQAYDRAVASFMTQANIHPAQATPFRSIFRTLFINTCPQPVQEVLRKDPYLETQEQPVWRRVVLRALKDHLDKKTETTVEVSELQSQLLKLQLKEARDKLAKLKSTPKGQMVQASAEATAAPSPATPPVAPVLPVLTAPLVLWQGPSDNWGEYRGQYGGGGRRRRRGRGGRSQGRGSGPPGGQNTPCFNCGQMGHWARECDFPPAEYQNTGGRGWQTAPQSMMAPGRGRPVPHQVPQPHLAPAPPPQPHHNMYGGQPRDDIYDCY